MTTTAKGLQVLKDIVSVFLGRCSSVAVNMVNLKVILASAMLAGVIVTLQSCVPVSSEIVVVAGLLGVLLQAIFVADKPLANLAYFVRLLADRASFLRSRSVLKVFSAIGTVQNGPCGNAALFCTKFAQGFNVLLSLVFWRTAFANLLDRASRLKYSLTHSASFWFVGHWILLSRNICILTHKVK
jgi:hypothetical protein